MKEYVEKFFPFTIRSYDTGHYIQKPEGFKPIWLSIKPEGFTWYAFNVTIKSPTEIEFEIFDMLCMASGGIGDSIGKFATTVDADVTRRAIYERAGDFAERQRADELLAIEKRIIHGYTTELLQLVLSPTVDISVETER